MCVHIHYNAIRIIVHHFIVEIYGTGKKKKQKTKSDSILLSIWQSEMFDLYPFKPIIDLTPDFME